MVGIDVGTSEDGAFWLQFLRSLVARGLSDVQLVTSGAHRGLREAIATVFAGASWPRCRTHFMTDLLSRVPKRVQPAVATMARTMWAPARSHCGNAWTHAQNGPADSPERASMRAHVIESNAKPGPLLPKNLKHSMRPREAFELRLAPFIEIELARALRQFLEH